MDLTNKEKIYEWINRQYDTHKQVFTEIDKAASTYFEDAAGKPTLEEYNFSNRAELESMLNKYLGEKNEDVKEVCMREILRNLLDFKEKNIEDKKSRYSVPEYIYTL